MKTNAELTQSISEHIETFLGHIAWRIEVFTASRTRTNLAGALIAGLCVAALFCLVSMASDPFNQYLCLRITLQAIISYIGIALLLHKLWTYALNRLLPVWVLTAVFGSLVFVTITLASTVARDWHDPYAMQFTMREYLRYKLDAAQFVYIFLSLLTLPITATVHYAGAIVKAVKRWHGDPDDSLSILGG